jgi:hypothetical protein
MNHQVKPPAGWTEIEPEFEFQRQTFQRRRDGLVVSVEQELHAAYNVVTLPENHHQDNRVIDCIELGAEPEDAAETARAFMEQNNATMDETLTDTDDPRSEAMRISMAEHFEDFEYEYREDPHTDAEVVHEDDQVIVVADNTGHELAEWMSDFNMTGEHRDAFYSWNHEVARELTDHSWSVVDPVVFDKLGKATRQ